MLVRMIEMFATGDLAGASETVADDYRDHQGLDGVEIRGATGFCDVVRAARSAYMSLNVWAVDVISDRERAAARIRWQGTLPSGVVVDRETIDIIRIAAGRAVEHWGCRISNREAIQTEARPSRR